MFDPFGDFATRGYLRNSEGILDLDEIKQLEHLNFRANLQDAIGYLRKIKGVVRHDHVLEVHRILFGDLYEWAGQDRLSLGVGHLINKGSVQFEASGQIRMAMAHALDLGNDKAKMQQKPGTVMGMMAWAHPFLDGNGRTMLLVHGELCHRAGFAIDWNRSVKSEYLAALTAELDRPGKGILDGYMIDRKRSRLTSDEWHEVLDSLPGLAGVEDLGQAQAYSSDDAEAAGRYREAVKRRSGPT